MGFGVDDQDAALDGLQDGFGPLFFLAEGDFCLYLILEFVLRLF